MAAVSEGEPLSSSPGAGADSPTKITGWGGGHGGGGAKKEEGRGLVPLRKSYFPARTPVVLFTRAVPLKSTLLITGSKEQFLAPRVFLVSSSHAGSLVVHPAGSCRVSHPLGQNIPGPSAEQGNDSDPISFLHNS